MGPKRNPPRPTQKIGGESLERMARVSTGLDPLVKPDAFSLPDEALVDATVMDPPPSVGRTRTLARTVKRADLELGKGGNVDEDDWGEIEIEGNELADGSGGVESNETLEVDDPRSLAGPAESRAITNDDPVRMAMMAEVARADFDHSHADEAAHAAHGGPVGTREKTPNAHPHLMRREK
ncbi:MAG TPA: hypothetical protein VGM39_03115 [Kofleriaceae bacterium]